MFKNFINRWFGEKKDAISFKQGFDLTELPIITLQQKDKKLNFLLDTGSNNSIIDKNVLDEIEYELIDKQSHLFGIDGKKKKLKFCTIVLNYKDNKYKYEYLINDMSDAFGHIKKDTGVTVHGIIGSLFFNEFKYVLDFDELIAYSK